MTGEPRRPGVVFVGAGPGDPGLLTVRGQRVLAEAEVVVFDGGIPATLLDAVDDAAERVPVDDGAGDGAPRAVVPSVLVSRAQGGRRVVRLVRDDAGDVGREASAVVAAGLALEVVPGVGAATAGPAYAGIPLDATTIVRRVKRAELAAVATGLVAGGLSPATPAAVISRPGTRRQRAVTARLDRVAQEAGRGEAGDAEAGEGVLLVVGDGVRARARLGWLESRPLHGRRVLVTRPLHQASGFAALLEDYGAEVVALPTIRLVPPEDWGPLDAAIGRLAGFAWLVFTSANGVSAFKGRLRHAGRDARALAGVAVAAIGPETAEALRRIGVEPDVVPAEYRAEGLVDALRGRVAPGAEVLLVRAAEARETLPDELRAAGARVTVAPAYRTMAAKEGGDRVAALLAARRIDAVTFTSSSTVRGLVALLGPEEVRRLLAGVALAAIGPITAATLAEHGLEVSVMPREYTGPALAAALAGRFAQGHARADETARG